jgi:hypothetical protein
VALKQLLKMLSSPQASGKLPNPHKTNLNAAKNRWHLSYAQPAIIKTIEKKEKAQPRG